jgi:tetratricopeptide (TPR) repeat protein
MATTEIEKLERRYAENPQGLTFAPLAEVHRKNGDVARALELLRAGLELHPNYIPASIVLGRCHWDLGDLPAAESAFSHVLRLDDENVIALKSLADINEKLERFTEAQRWLNRLISVDRSNDEARQQLARLETVRQQPKAVEAPLPPPPLAEKQPAPVQEAKAPEAEAQEARTEGLRAAEAKAEDANTEVAEAPKAEEAPVPVLDFIDTTEPAAEPAPVDGLISQEFVPPRETYRSHPELTQEVVPAEERSAEPVLESLEVETASEVELQSSGASEFRVPNAAEDFMEAAFAAVAPMPAHAPTPAPPPPEPPPAKPAPLPEIDLTLALPPEKPPEPSYSSRDAKGQSVAAFFAAMLAARPPGATGPVAAPETNQGAKEEKPKTDGVGDKVSFDDFFGATPAEASPAPKGSTDPSKEDLDQFQSWLQNLKR